MSWKLGYGGEINEVVGAVVQNNPSLSMNHSFVTVFNWLISGAYTTFLQDADSLIGLKASINGPRSAVAASHLPLGFSSNWSVLNQGRGVNENW
jgi:hypothetical protein